MLFLASGVPGEKEQWQVSALRRTHSDGVSWHRSEHCCLHHLCLEGPDVRQALNRHLGVGWKYSHILFSCFPLTFSYKKIWTYRKVEWLVEKLSEHPKNLHPGWHFALCATSSIYLSHYLPISPFYLFYSFQGEVQTILHLTPKHFSPCIIK